jgi:xylulokinase
MSQFLATIGIDIGSSSVKVGAFDKKGNQLMYQSEPYPTYRLNDGRIEQNPEHWISCIRNAFKKFIQNGIKNVDAISFCAQVNTHIFVDKTGKNLLPAIFWQDVRADEESAELESMVSEEQKIAWWGSPMPIDSSHILSRMLWVKRNKPEVWEKTRYVLLPKDYCLLKLTGECFTDPLSNIGLVNNNSHYIDEVLNLVEGASERMASIRGISDHVGNIIWSDTYFNSKVINGSMDAWMGLVGAGVSKNNTSAYLSGTSEILGVNSKKVIPTNGVILFPEFHDVKLHAGPTQSGGASKLWFCDLFQLNPEQMEKLAKTALSKNSCPIFLPHLQGERAPIWQSHLSGVFFGLNTKTDRNDLARSVYEGVAFSAKWLLESLQVSSDNISDQINCGGGGFRSSTWNQVRANVLNKRLNCLKVRDPGILGAVATACFGLDEYSSLDDAISDKLEFEKIYEPKSEEVERYEDLFQLYKKLTDDSIARNKEWLY